MNVMKFEFNYKGSFKEIDVRTEKLNVIIAKGQADIVVVKGEILMTEEVNYGMGDDKLVQEDREEMRLAIHSDDFEDDLESRDVDLENSKLIIMIPDGMKVRVESEMGKIRFEDVQTEAEIDSELGSITLDSVSGNVKIESEIGSVEVRKGDFQNFFCSTEIGNIDIKEIKAHRIKCDTEVGQINIKEAEVSDVTISSETGNIEYQLLPIKQNQTKINSEIGKVKLIIPHEMNVDLKATSEIGTVSSFLKNIITNQIDDGVILKSEIINSETGNAVISVSTEIGTIVLVNEDTMPEEEKQQFENNKFNKEFNKAMNEMSKVTKVLASPALRKSIGGAFANLGEVIKNSVQNALKEADVTIKESMKDMKADMQKQRQDMKSDNMRNRQDRAYSDRKTGFRAEERLSDNEKSRLKILDLLEQGKINHEEAEKLLKAINK
ncbi:DUF4097 family beta strand repeat protein [bacterium]|nr:DUF4097 family beta strand repeat protein [bacterium]